MMAVLIYLSYLHGICHQVFGIEEPCNMIEFHIGSIEFGPSVCSCQVFLSPRDWGALFDCLLGDGLVGVPKKVVLSTIALNAGVSNKSIF